MHYEAVGETYMGRALTVRSVTVRSYDSQDALVMALRTGEVDAMYDYTPTRFRPPCCPPSRVWMG